MNVSGDAEVGGALSASGGELPRSKSYENWLVVLLAAAAALAFYDRAAISYLFPAIVPEFDLQMWQVGVITSAMSLTQGVSGWVFGSTSDRIGRKAVLVPVVLAYSLLTWLTGVTTSFAQMVAARIVVGITVGPVYPVSIAAMMEASTPSRRGINGGVITALGTASGFAATPIIAVQLASTVGWRWAFFVAGVPGLVITALLWKLLRESPSFARPKAGVPESRSIGRRLLESLRFRNVRLAALYNVLTMTFIFVFTSFGPLYLTKDQHLSMGAVGMAMASFGVGGVVGALVLPAASDYLGRRPTLSVATLAMGLALVGFMFGGDSSGVLTAILFVAGVGSGSIGVLTTTVVESVPSNLAAGALSASMLVGTVFGSTAMPIVTGVLADVFGRSVPIYVAAGGGIVGGIVAFFLTETAPRAVARRGRIERNASA